MKTREDVRADLVECFTALLEATVLSLIAIRPIIKTEELEKIRKVINKL